jgi:hypothetical protein
MYSGFSDDRFVGMMKNEQQDFNQHFCQSRLNTL